MKAKSWSAAAGDGGRESLRRRRLVYGLTASILGVPVGLALDQPVVWGLGLLGIVIGGLKAYSWRRG